MPKSINSALVRLQRAAFVATGLSGIFLSACSDSFDEKFGGSAWESTHFRYRSQGGDPMACSDVLPQLEAYATILAEALNVDESALGVITYYKYPTPAAFRAAGVCRSTASACADSDEIFASVPLFGHELVHSVMAKRTGMNVSRLLMEGLANALTCQPGTVPNSFVWDFRAFAATPTVADVVQAGRLVLAMLQHLEPDELIAIIASIGDGVTLEETRQRVLDGWKLDFDALLKDVLTSRLGACVPLFACSGAPITATETTLRVGCHGFDPATLPMDAGPIALHVAGKALRLMPCDLRQATSPLERLSIYRAVGDWEYWMASPSAKHALWIDQVEEIDYATESRVSMRQTPNLFSTVCSLQAPAAIARDKQVAIVVTGAEGVVHFPLSFGQAIPLKLGWQSGQDYDSTRLPESPMRIDWCNGCANGVASDCITIDQSSGRPQTIQTNGQGVLVIRPTEPTRKAAVLEVTPLFP